MTKTKPEMYGLHQDQYKFTFSIEYDEDHISEDSYCEKVEVIARNLKEAHHKIEMMIDMKLYDELFPNILSVEVYE